MAHKSGHVDADGNIVCPHIEKDGTMCGYSTYPSGERKVVEVHAKLCTDVTIHYPAMRKAGTITEEQFQAWKSTLSREELLGNYKRTPDLHICVQLRDDEAALVDTDLAAFNTLLQQRLKEKAETQLRYSAPYSHKTSKTSINL
ncbi:hypothetical protein [Edaphobacter modestus]|nr:hypothetical protein [Edaphobacter modestus]